MRFHGLAYHRILLCWGGGGLRIELCERKVRLPGELDVAHLLELVALKVEHEPIEEGHADGVEDEHDDGVHGEALIECPLAVNGAVGSHQVHVHLPRLVIGLAHEEHEGHGRAARVDEEDDEEPQIRACIGEVRAETPLGALRTAKACAQDFAQDEEQQHEHQRRCGLQNEVEQEVVQQRKNTAKGQQVDLNVDVFEALEGGLVEGRVRDVKDHVQLRDHLAQRDQDPDLDSK